MEMLREEAKPENFAATYRQPWLVFLNIVGRISATAPTIWKIRSERGLGSVATGRRRTVPDGRFLFPMPHFGADYH